MLLGFKSEVSNACVLVGPKATNAVGTAAVTVGRGCGWDGRGTAGGADAVVVNWWLVDDAGAAVSSAGGHAVDYTAVAGTGNCRRWTWSGNYATNPETPKAVDAAVDDAWASGVQGRGQSRQVVLEQQHGVKGVMCCHSSSHSGAVGVERNVRVERWRWRWQG